MIETSLLIAFVISVVVIIILGAIIGFTYDASSVMSIIIAQLFLLILAVGLSNWLFTVTCGAG